MRKVNDSCQSYFGEPSLAVWESDIFIAGAFNDNGVVRLDVRRKDLKDGITWDELQEIKDACGFQDCDAVEFYPRKQDILNTGTARHLYIFSERLPMIRRPSSPDAPHSQPQEDRITRFIFVGQKFVDESDGLLSCFVNETENRGGTWEEIFAAIANHEKVFIRPATELELSCAESNLAILKANKQSAPC